MIQTPDQSCGIRNYLDFPKVILHCGHLCTAVVNPLQQNGIRQQPSQPLKWKVHNIHDSTACKQKR